MDTNAAGLHTYLLVIYCTKMTPSYSNAHPRWRQQLPVTESMPTSYAAAESHAAHGLHETDPG